MDSMSTSMSNPTTSMIHDPIQHPCPWSNSYPLQLTTSNPTLNPLLRRRHLQLALEKEDTIKIGIRHRNMGWTFNWVLKWTWNWVWIWMLIGMLNWIASKHWNLDWAGAASGKHWIECWLASGFGSGFGCWIGCWSGCWIGSPIVVRR